MSKLRHKVYKLIALTIINTQDESIMLTHISYPCANFEKPNYMVHGKTIYQKVSM